MSISGSFTTLSHDFSHSIDNVRYDLDFKIHAYAHIHSMSMLKQKTINYDSYFISAQYYYYYYRSMSVFTGTKATNYYNTLKTIELQLNIFVAFGSIERLNSI